MSTQPAKLRTLLHLLWKSPVFGDSFPAEGLESRVMTQFDWMYARLAEALLPVLRQALPGSAPAESTAIVEQIAPKSIAFCAAISAGEIRDTQRLLNAAAAISISYWADQSMDRGDEWMLAAVQFLNHKSLADELSNAQDFRARLEGLRHIQRFASQITRSADDLPYALQAIERDVLGNQAQMRTLSLQFLQSQADDFWNVYAQDVAQTMIDCSGLMSAVAIIYAIYRLQQPDLPSLNEIYSHPALMRLVRATFNVAVRVFDDAGDCYIDTGRDAAWGSFNLNIFNQSHPKLLRAFLEYAEISENHALRAEILTSFALPLSESRAALANLFMRLTRQRMAALPEPLWRRYQVFLTLCKRTLEAGFINVLGDAFLSENAHPSTFERDFLKMIGPDSRFFSSGQEAIL
ncbi:MAG: hypothetical protein OHK0010_03960 [Anaerolineales bacterium]